MKCGTRMVLLLLMIPAADAGAQDKSAELIGSWKELRRMPAGGSPQDFADTSFYDFMIGNEYASQRKASFMYRGAYKATAGILDLGMRVYNVLDMSPNRMLLKDDAGTYEFVRYDKAAAMSENNSAASSTDRAYQEAVKGGRINTGELAGKWEVYKRTSSTTMEEPDYDRIIQVIEIKSTGRRAEGNVFTAKDMRDAPSWRITRFEKNVLYCTGKDNRQLKVLRCTNGELIVQEDSITYFFKQFK